MDFEEAKDDTGEERGGGGVVFALDAELAREFLFECDCANAIRLTVPVQLERKTSLLSGERCSKKSKVTAVSIRSIRESFATFCVNVRRLSLVGHSVRTLEDLEPLRKLLFLYDLKLQTIDGQFANPVCEVFGYRKIVSESRVRRAVGVFRWRKSWKRRDEYAGKVGRECETRSFGIRGGKENE